jgi:beta-xylosidase
MDNNFKNPMFPGADPFVLFYEDSYYMYCTTESTRKDGFGTATDEGDGFYVYTSPDLKNWQKLGYALKKGDSIGNCNFWAPEVLFHNGKFYMVYSAEEHIAIAVANHPTGPFIQHEKKWLRNEKAIDGSLFVDDDGSVYLYYVRLSDANRIFVAKMTDDLSAIEKEFDNCLIEPDTPWELIDAKVTEGPFVLKHNGFYYLTYSANHTRCKDYAVGYALSKSPVGPFVKFDGNPILKRNDKLQGVGHHSFMKTPNGKFICAYHSHSLNKDDFRPRMFCLNTAEFVKNENGADILTINGPFSIS